MIQWHWANICEILLVIIGVFWLQMKYLVLGLPKFDLYLDSNAHKWEIPFVKSIVSLVNWVWYQVLDHVTWSGVI